MFFELLDTAVSETHPWTSQSQATINTPFPLSFLSWFCHLQPNCSNYIPGSPVCSLLPATWVLDAMPLCP